VRNYEKETKEQLSQWLNNIKYANSRVGMVYNCYPANTKGFDMSQAISMGDMNNETE